MRRVNILSSGLTIDRLVKSLEAEGYTAHSNDINEWRATTVLTFDGSQRKSECRAMRVAALGRYLHQACHNRVIWEGAINFSTEEQTIWSARHGSSTYAARLGQDHLYRKKSQKMFGEIVEWSTGDMATKIMEQLLRDAGYPDAHNDLDDNATLANASKLMHQRLQGLDEDAGAATPHSNAYAGVCNCIVDLEALLVQVHCSSVNT